MTCTRAVSRAMALQEPPIRVPGIKNHSVGTIVNLGSPESYVTPARIIPYTISKTLIVDITERYGT